MERFHNAIPDELRSPAQALADLLDKFDCMAGNNPELPVLERMILQLAEEIVLRKRAQRSPRPAWSTPGWRVGLVQGGRSHLR
jgi:hypothetical protein